MWNCGASRSWLVTSSTPSTTSATIVSWAATVNHHSAGCRRAGSQCAASAHRPASAFETTTTHATATWTSWSSTDPGARQALPGEVVDTSYDHSSLDTETGPPSGCGRSVPRCP